MGVTADQVVVELIAKLDQYERNMDRAGVTADRNFGKIETGSARAAAGISRAANVMRSALAGLGVAFSVGSIVQMTSAWTDLNSRIENATGSTERAEAVMSRLQDMARRTYSSLTQTAESYLQNSQALTAMGYSTQQQLDLTEALNNSLVISATRGDRARQVMDAWTKAMASGSLRGDNLNTIIQSGGRLSKALADSMGISVNELRRMGEQGKITSDVMFGVTGQLATLREEADRMPATVTDGFVLLQNAVLTFVGEADKAVGSSALLAEALVRLADAVGSAPETSWFDTVFSGIGDKIGYEMMVAEGHIKNISTVLSVIERDGADVFRNILDPSFVTPFEQALMDVEDAWRRVSVEAYNATSGEVQKQINDIISGINNETIAADDASKMLAQLAVSNPEAEPFISIMRAWTDSLYAVRDGAIAAAQGMSAIGAFPSARQFQNFSVDLSNDGAPGGVNIPPKPGGSGGGKSPNQKFQDDLDAQRRRNDELMRETELRGQLNPLINDYGYAVEKLRIQMDLENNAIRNGLELTPERAAAIEVLAETYATAKVAAEQLDESQKALKESAEAWAETLQGAARGFIDDLMEGKSVAEAFSNSLNKIADQLLDMALSSIFGGIFGGGGIGGIFGGLFGGFRANGGPVSSARTYLVGERGPELFTPSSAGNITPNHALGGGSRSEVTVVVESSEYFDGRVARVSGPVAARTVAAGISQYDSNLSSRMVEQDARNN